MPSITEHKGRTLTDILDTHASELMEKWAYRNKNRVWVGHNSREKMREELIEQMRWAYNLAKDKYTK